MVPMYGIPSDPKSFPAPGKIFPKQFSDENKNSIH